MRILIFEDRAVIMKIIYDFVESLGHTIYRCYNVYEAKDALQESKKNGTTIDCYIFDLAMSSDGLDTNLETNDDYFTGWVFIKNNVLNINEIYANKCIIYSSYLDSFINNYKNNKYYEKDYELIKKMLTIDKTDLNWRDKLKDKLIRLGE